MQPQNCLWEAEPNTRVDPSNQVTLQSHASLCPQIQVQKLLHGDKTVPSVEVSWRFDPCNLGSSVQENPLRKCRNLGLSLLGHPFCGGFKATLHIKPPCLSGGGPLKKALSEPPIFRGPRSSFPPLLEVRPFGAPLLVNAVGHHHQLLGAKRR